MTSTSYPSDPWESESALTADARPTKVRWTIFGLSCCTSFLLYLHRYTWGMIKADVAEEFGWNTVTLGLLDSCFNLSYALGQIPFGILGDWFGPRLVLGTTIAVWSVTMAATTLAGGLATMYVARFGFGLAQSGCYSNLTKVTKLWFPQSVRTTVQGWVASFSGRSGGAASNVILGTLLLGMLAMDWRTAINLLAVLGIAFAGLFLWLYRNRPAEHPWSNAAEVELITSDDPDAAIATRSMLNWRTTLRNGNMLIFLFQQFTSAFADNLFPYWIPLFLLVEKGVDFQTAGMLAALPLLGGACGGMIGGTLQTALIVRTGNRRWTRSAIGCVGKLLAAILMYVSLAFSSPATILWIFAAVKFFGDWSQPTVWGTATDIGGGNSASVFSLVNTVGSLAGFVAGPAMGALIFYFSQDVPIQNEVVTADVLTTETGAEPDAGYRTRAKLEHRALVEGTVNGTVNHQGQPVATFTVSRTGTFQFTPADAPDSAPRLIPENCTLQLNKGAITLAWRAPPADVSLDVNYQYTQYGHGWTALFVSLSVIYLASSLSWLLIDCTKKLESRGAADRDR